MYSLITASPKDWAAKTNIKVYAERQAQSCQYLEKVFRLISVRVFNLDRQFKEDLLSVFNYLLEIHRRQYKDLEAVTFIPQGENRKSHYFGSMYANYGLDPLALPDQLDNSQLCSLLGIQAVSYMRGRDRYDILRGCMQPANDLFRAIWAKFFMDATGNAIKVSELIAKYFGVPMTDEKIREVLTLEDRMMKRIWRRNNVTGA